MNICRKMGRSMTKFVKLTTLCLTIFCLMHITLNLIVNWNPLHPDVMVHDKPLKDVSFPILFKICGKEIHNSSNRFKKFGYINEINFFAGKSKYSKNVYGWTGHTENGSSMGISPSGTRN